jgi:hypothetical protein
VQARVTTAHLRDLRTGKTVALSRRATRIGRDPDNDVVIAERQVSGHHAEIECRQGRFYLRDLQSTNGTWINEIRVRVETPLETGDVIRFDLFSYAFYGPDSNGAGTMLRDFRGRALVAEAPRSRQAASALAETVCEYEAAAENSSVGLQRCPTHLTLEMTERCERCGSLWCALCTPPIRGERVCKRCQDAGEGHGDRPGSPLRGSTPGG